MYSLFNVIIVCIFLIIRLLKDVGGCELDTSVFKIAFLISTTYFFLEHIPTDLSDPLDPAFWEFWKAQSTANTAIYDYIDGDTSVYHCTTLVQYATALGRHTNPSVSDPEVRAKMSEIKGFLVDWPEMLLVSEDLSPPLVASMVLPNEVWV